MIHARNSRPLTRRFLHRLRANLLAVCTLLPAAGAHRADGATLQALIDGATVDAGNARLNNWELISLDVAGGPNPDLALVTVTPMTSDPSNPVLHFAANGQLSVAGVSALDLSLRYRIQAMETGNSFSSHSLQMTGLAFGGNGGIAYISQDVVDQHGVNLGSAVAIADHESEFFQFTAEAAHAPRLGMSVNVNIFLQGLSAGDSIVLSTFTQRFFQTGPASLVGDFNQDKRVDAADFIVWQRGASPNPLSQQDLSAWRTHFGESIAAATAAAAAPEPPAAALVVSAACVVLWRQNTRGFVAWLG